MTTLRSKAIHLAQANPAIRGELLPLLKTAQDSDARAFIEQELESLKKGGYWKPPHNLALNFALMGANFWTFTILPLFWQRKAYRKDLNGIVIHPIWTSVANGRTIGPKNMSGFSELDMKTAQDVVSTIRRAESVQDSVRHELKAIETQFGIDIPTSIVSDLIQDSLKVAKRRWGVDRMKVKDRLIPFDGSPARDLSAWGGM